MTTTSARTDYMLACWKFKYRDQTGATSLDQLAKR